MHHIVICGMAGSTKDMIFEEKKKVTEHKMCVLILSTNII